MISLLFATLAAQAAPVTTQTQPAPAAEEKKVCRREVDTGTIIRKKTCRLPSEWKAIDSNNKAHADRFNESKGSRGGLRPTD